MSEKGSDVKLNLKMKRILLILVAVIGFVVSANAQSATVKEVRPTISSSTVTLTVEVLPTFTPTEAGHYVFVVSPTGTMRSILDSTSKSTTIYYDGKKWSSSGRTVSFTCSVEDNSYKQCRTQDFSISVQKSR